MGAYLDSQTKTGIRLENWVQRAVQLILRVADGRGGRYKEGEGDASRKIVQWWDWVLI